MSDPLRTGLDLAHHRPLLPRELPDGTVVWDEHLDITNRLRGGDPTLGWAGDEGLTLCRNVKEGRWEVWRRCEDGEARLVLTKRGQQLKFDQLLRMLGQADSRHRDVLGEMDAHNAAVEREQQREFDDHHEAAGDKLAWALGRDLGEPMQDGRVVPVSGPSERRPVRPSEEGPRVRDRRRVR